MRHVQGNSRIPCPSCRGMYPDVEGPTHRYLYSSPGCWMTVGQVWAREYSDPSLLEVHRISVDAYAAQHPGRPSSQSTRSVGCHLVRLCCLFENGLLTDDANRAMIECVRIKDRFHWLTPPPSLGRITAADVVRAESPEEHRDLVRAWAASVWEAWTPHHEQVRKWASLLDLVRS